MPVLFRGEVVKVESIQGRWTFWDKLNSTLGKQESAFKKEWKPLLFSLTSIYIFLILGQSVEEENNKHVVVNCWGITFRPGRP